MALAGAGDVDEAAEEKLAQYFGSIFAGIHILFQCMSSGISWHEVDGALQTIHWSYAVIMSLFVCFMTFAVLNIITGVFVEGAINQANSFREAVIADEKEKEAKLRLKLEDIF